MGNRVHDSTAERNTARALIQRQAEREKQRTHSHVKNTETLADLRRHTETRYIWSYQETR